MSGRVVVFAPDLMDRSRITAAVPDAVVVASVTELAGTAGAGDVVVVDLSRPGVIDAIRGLPGRVVGYGSHVDKTTLDAARDAGCDEVLTRSRFFADPLSVLRPRTL